MENREVTAIIVARKGSVRIPSKSLLKIDGISLIERKILQLKQCKNIDRIVLGSDSDEMLTIGKNAGSEVVKRPDYFCNEKLASANEMIQNMMELVKTDVVIWTHCTNPFITPQTYDHAIETFFKNLKNYDSLLSVVKFQEHLWDDKMHPLNYNPYAPRHTPARELPVYYFQDGGIFIQPYEQMKKNSYFFGKKPYLFEIPENEFLDINTKFDYQKALVFKKIYASGDNE